MAETMTKRTKPSSNGATPRTEEAAPNHPLAQCRPLDDRVVVRRDINKSNESRGGILIPETAMSNEKQQTGTVWAVGPGARHPQTGEVVPVPLAKGQRVIITGYAGLEIRDPLTSQQEEFVILRFDDIVAKLPPFLN